MSTSINIIPNDNVISVQNSNNQLTITNNISNVTVGVTQPITSIVQVLTGPQGSKGDTGPVGPSGSAGTVDTGSLVTTASFNSFTSSYYQDSGSMSNIVGTLVSTSSFNSFTSSYNTGSFTGSFTGSILADTVTTVGNTSLAAVQEKFISIDGTPSPSHSFDFNSGSIFYLTRQSENTTWNIINLPTVPENAITLTFIIEQQETAYSASEYQFNGDPISVKWPQGIIPTGSASVTDAIGLTAFRFDSTWTVLGSLTPFV